MSDVAILVLAAGSSARFGQESKLLAEFRGKPLIRLVAEAASGATACPVIVVTGHGSQDVEAALEGLPVRSVYNPSFADGLSTSLKAGFAALPAETRAAIVLLGDMPLVTAGLIDGLAAAWRAGGEPAALIPTLDGRRGNPVLISRRLQGLIEELSGDAGAGAALRGRQDVVEWPTTDRAILQDVDTRAELDRLG